MYLQEFSERLTELMERRKLKSEKLGSALGCAGSTIRAWCKGSQAILLKNAVKLAVYFDCSLDYLFGRSETERGAPQNPLPPFYPQLRAVMRECGVTRYRLILETPLKDSYLTAWRDGSDPNMLNVLLIADYLNVSLDYLAGISNLH